MQSFMHDAYTKEIDDSVDMKIVSQSEPQFIKSCTRWKGEMQNVNYYYFYEKEVKYTRGCHGWQVPHYKLELFIIIAIIIIYLMASNWKKSPLNIKDIKFKYTLMLRTMLWKCILNCKEIGLLSQFVLLSFKYFRIFNKLLNYIL